MDAEPLNKLLVDSQKVDKKRIVQALEALIGIDSETGAIVIKPDFNNLTSKQKVTAYLLGKKVASILELEESKTVEPKFIPKETGIPGGTVRPQLKRLLEDRIITKSKDGNYYIENYQVISAIDILK